MRSKRRRVGSPQRRPPGRGRRARGTAGRGRAPARRCTRAAGPQGGSSTRNEPGAADSRRAFANAMPKLAG
eukprot:scaffold88681_cov65-Phaeocystis_antarctica.AAC.2